MKCLLFCLVVGLMSQLVPAHADNTALGQDANTLTTIAKLEARYFGHSYNTDDTDYRLTRLENFMFGATHPGSPAQRVNTIMTVINTQEPPAGAPGQQAGGAGASAQIANKPAAAGKPTNNFANPLSSVPGQTANSGNDMGSDGDDAPATSTASSVGNYPHITVLEKEILGQAYETDPLPVRLSRMEKSAFGTPSSNPDLSSRTDALENYAQKQLHKKPFVRDQYANKTDADALDNNDFSAPGRSPAPRYLGLGPANTPWSSYRQNPTPSARPVDPDADIAAQATPPSSNAQMLARVAWCEQHLFGRTYPELHLLQRLHQLNANLFPNDHEKDIQLMDRLDTIVKEVVLRQHPPQQTATNSQLQ